MCPVNVIWRRLFLYWFVNGLLFLFYVHSMLRFVLLNRVKYNDGWSIICGTLWLLMSGSRRKLCVSLIYTGRYTGHFSAGQNIKNKNQNKYKDNIIIHQSKMIQQFTTFNFIKAHILPGMWKLCIFFLFLP